jgi:thiol-disulfide isomerase/thioredoxin
VYRFYKQHYWDGVSFADERLIRSPFFEPKLDKYFDNVLYGQSPDTLKKECDKMLAIAARSKQMYQYLLDKFTRKYINPTYMGQDAVFVHLFEKYYANGSADYWLTDSYRKQVFDRAYSLMSNLIGEKAADLEMLDTTGVLRTLYSVTAKYTVVCFWDPTCGHCQKEIPQLDSFYQKKWKALDLSIYGIMVDGGKDNWTKYIREHNLSGWFHVYQTKEMKDAEMNSGKPGYKQLFDVFQTPTLYLLDKEKRIIAKRLNPEQLDELLDNLQKKTTN